MIGPTKLCPQGIELLLFDLDDTTVIDGTKISPRVLEAIRKVRAQGCVAGVASGRPLVMVPPVMRDPDCMDYFICANGSAVHDSHGEAIYQHLMSSEQVLELMDAMAPFKPGWNAFIGDVAYFEWRNFTYMAVGRRPNKAALTKGAGTKSLRLGMMRYARRALRFAKRMVFKREGRRQVLSVRPAVKKAEEGVLKVGCSFATSDACTQAVAIIESLGSFQVARMGGHELEITSAGVTKATAAQWLMGHLGIDAARVVAFGDSQNDLPLAEACGTFVAMGNATERVRAEADDVCESVYDDGVALWIERALSEADGAADV